MFVELIILLVLAAVVVIGIRYGRTAAPESPVIIHQPGRYHITLAPQLTPAQAFIENIAEQFSAIHQPQGDIPTVYFEVHDPNLSALREKFYLLAAAYRGGALYFQAINPQPLLRDADSHLKTVRDFSAAVLVQIPLSESGDELGTAKLCAAVESAAQQNRVIAKILRETD